MLLLQWPATAQAQSQSLYGNRLASKDGAWLLPVATLHLGSDEEDHIGRGSIASWDLVAPLGTPVFAVGPGVVRVTGCDLFEKRQWHNMQGYGCAIQIDHGDSISTQYGHCQQGSFFVKAGDTVDGWAPICRVGWTGKTSFGPHLHFVILRGGAAARVDAVFDIAKMYHKPLSNAVGSTAIESDIGVVGGNGTATASQQATGGGAAIGEARIYILLRSLNGIKPEQLIGVYFVFFLSIGFLLWLGNNLVRMVVIGILTGAATALAIVWLFVPPMASAAAPASASVAGGGDWEAAYEVVQGREGWKCTNDGAYTMGGVTQGTYNRWRRSHGMGTADVCANLTKAQAQAIFYELYWLEIGADQLPPRLALTAVDHYYNTGAVRHLLAQCGQDVACFNRARIADYQTKGNCSLYCTAWINRVNHLRRLTE